MAYASWSVVFGEQPSAAKWNILGTNDSSFNDGTGIASLSLSTTSLSNPYKFSAYSTAGHNVGTSPTKVQYNNEYYDTNNNFDSTTNYRYTVPVTGFYQFNIAVSTSAAGGGTNVAAYLYKNGSNLRLVDFSVAAAGNPPQVTGAPQIQATAADYFEVYVGTGTAAKALDTTAGNVVFEGYLMYRT